MTRAFSKSLRMAFAAVITDGFFGIGVAEEDEPGYFPMPDYGQFSTYDAAVKKAEELNRQWFPNRDEVANALIVASSMRGRGRSKAKAEGKGEPR